MLYLRPVHIPAFVNQHVPSAPLARVGADAAIEVGAGAASTVAGGAIYLVAAGAQGLFSYALFTGKWIFKAKHPVWGVLFALGTMSALWGAADKLTAKDA